MDGQSLKAGMRLPPASRKSAAALAAALLVIALLATLSTAALVSVSRSSDRLIELYSDRTMLVRDLHASAQRRSSAARGFILSGSPALLEQTMQARDEFLEGLGRLGASMPSEASQAFIAELKRREAAHWRALLPIIDERRNGAAAPGLAERFEAQVTPAHAQFSRAIRDFADYEQGLLDAQETQADRVKASYAWVLAGTALVGLPLLVWFMFLNQASVHRLALKEAELAQSNKREEEERLKLEYLINHLDHSAVWEAVSDAQSRHFRFVFVSDRVQRVAGVSSSDWIADAGAFFEALPGEDRGKLLGMLASAARERRDLVCDHRLRTPHRGEIWVHTGGHPRKMDDGTVRFYGITMDVSDLKRTRQELAASEGRLKATLSEWEEALNVVSHDLRTPLGTVLLNARLLGAMASKRQLGEVGERAGVIGRAGTQMQRIIDDLLDAANMERGRFKVEPSTRCTVASLVQDAAELVQPRAAEKGLELVTEVQGRPASMTCDHAQMLRVLTNLLENALKFTPGGGTVALRAKAHEREVHFVVADTGPGIPRDHLPRIFSRHWRGTTDTPGAGLGLYISKSIVEAHGGRIWAKSEFGQGAEFHFVLPASEARP